MTTYVDAKKYLVVGTEALQKTAQGDMKVVATFSNFATSKGGIVYPAAMKIVTGPMEVLGKVTRYEENVAFDKKLFAKPVERRAIYV